MDDTIYHHGIKGQKWGVRRTPEQLGRTSGSRRNKSGSNLISNFKKVFSSKRTTNKRSISQEHQVKKPVQKKKKISELTDDELRARIARLELEKRYRDLTPKKTHRGRDFVLSVLETSGKNIATQTTTYMLGQGVNKLAEALGSDDPHIINPKKGQKDK